MSPPHPPNMLLTLPRERPAIQREYTASPPTRQDCTPSTSHGFIPLGTATPLPTAAAGGSTSSTFDYFSLPQKEATTSPDIGGYEPHGFIPFCSVAAVEEGNEAIDYFSHIKHRASRRTSTSSIPKHSSSQSSPRRADLTKKTPSLHEGMMHPTGSPVHPRDVLHHCTWNDIEHDKRFTLSTPTKREDQPILSLRGGAIHDPAEEALEAERSRCSLTGNAMNDSTERQEINDELLPNRPSGHEQAALRHNNLDDIEAGANQSGTASSGKEETDAVHQSWAEKWLCLAQALELPASEPSEQDGDKNVPVETQLAAREVSPQIEYESSKTTFQGTEATPVVARSQPSFRFSSPRLDTPMPELPTEALPIIQASLPVHPETPIKQMIPPANLLTVPRPPTRPRLAKRHSSPLSPALQPSITHNQASSSTISLSIPRSPARPPISKHQPPPLPPNLTILQIAMHTDQRYLTSLLQGPTISITSSAPSTILISSVPLSMLTHFCPYPVLSNLLSPDFSTLVLPSDNLSCKSGLSRVLRFMTRCCLPHSSTLR